MDRRYPIGPWTKPEQIDDQLVKSWIKDIEKLPNQLNQLLENHKPEDLSKTYREGSWTLRQVVHHIADSHINAYLRHKLCISVTQPTINPYPEEIWSEMKDVKELPIEVSLQLINSLHLRWSVFLTSLESLDYQKGFIHPQHQRLILMEESIGMYSWHGRHHLEHVRLMVGR